MKRIAMRELRWAIEAQYGCKAVPSREQTVHVRDGDRTLWYGTVTSFSLEGHPSASTAYGWYSVVPATGESEYFFALHGGPVTSPEEAVRAAMAAIRQGHTE